MENTKVTKEEMMEEAIKRMKEIGVGDFSIDVFKEGKLAFHHVTLEDNKNMRVRIGVAEENLIELVRKMEEENNCKAYLLTVTETSMGDIVNAFIVFPDKEEWEMAHTVIELDHNVATFAFNLNLPEVSSFSIIRYLNVGGAICKVL